MQDQQPPGSGEKPKPPPGISDVTHAPVRLSIFEIVRDLRQHYLDARQPSTVEDLLVIVCPRTACEVYTWSNMGHADVRAYAFNRALITFGEYITSDVIGTVNGFCTCMSPLQREGWVNLVPFKNVGEWRRQAEEFHEAQKRSGGCR